MFMKKVVYVEIANDIENDIRKNLQPGDKIESESFYQNKYGVSRVTISRALQYLINKSVIYKIKNKGHFVLREFYSRGDEILSFTELHEKYGKVVTNEVLDIDLIYPGEEIRKLLELSYDDMVYRLVRTRFLNGIPVTLEYSHIVQKVADGLDRFNFERFSLYQILRENYDIVIDSQEYTFSGGLATEKEAEILNVQPNHPVLVTKAVGFTNKGETSVEYSKQISIISYSFTFTKNDNH
jgi:GntR family transcriptional regulator